MFNFMLTLVFRNSKKSAIFSMIIGKDSINRLFNDKKYKFNG